MSERYQREIEEILNQAGEPVPAERTQEGSRSSPDTPVFPQG